MKKKIIVFVTVLLCAFSLTGCASKREILKEQKETNNRLTNIEEILDGKESEDVTELRQQLADAQIQITELEQQTNGVTDDGTYVSLKFPSDGNYYKEAYDSVTFYSDPECTQKIFNVRFMSPEVDSTQAENGLSIYCLRMDNGKICYCTDVPYLITEAKYKETH